MGDARWVRAALGAVTAVMLVAGLVAVVMADDGGDRAVVRTATPSSTAPAGADGAEEQGTGGGEAATDATPGAGSAPASGPNAAQGGGTSATTAAPAPPPGSAPEAIGQPQPARVGTYTYTVTVDGESSEATQTVEAMSGAPAGETRQAQTTKTKQGDVRNQVRWAADAVYLESTSGSGGGGPGGDCDWNPDVVLLQLPLAKGKGWVSESSCSGQSAYGPYTLKARFESSVTGTARRTVGGEAVDVWVVQTKRHIEITAQYQGQQFNVTEDGTSTTFFAPRQGMTVREESSSTASFPTGQRKTTTTRDLQRLTPR